MTLAARSAIQPGSRGTALNRRGLVCDLAGQPLLGYLMTAANQEHGIVSLSEGRDADIVRRFPVGTRLRILPNHACATGAQHPRYLAVDAAGQAIAWERFYGWQ